jgi:hypothetical protein
MRLSRPIQNAVDLLLSELRHMRIGVEKQTDAITKQCQAQDQQQQSTHEYRAEVHVPEAIKVQTESTDTGQTRRDKIRLAIEGLALAGAVLIGYLAYQQWREMIITADATAEAAYAARRSAATAASTLEQAKGQFKETLEQMKGQTTAQNGAASAARSAANTAKETLHISERAYIVDGAPQLDTAKKTIAIPIVNSGRIPSGAVEIVAHELTVDNDDVYALTDLAKARERHWQRTKIRSISPGYPLQLVIPISAMEADRLNSGKQRTMIAGFILYYDGFPNTPEQRWPFCTSTTYHLKIKQVYMTTCDVVEVLPKMESLDGYPNNEAPR